MNFGDSHRNVYVNTVKPNEDTTKKKRKKIIIIAGATPNDITSAMESNSIPNSDSRPPMRATRPSKASQTTPKKINHTAWVKCPLMIVGSVA